MLFHLIFASLRVMPRPSYSTCLMSDNLSYHEQEKLLADAIKYKQQHPEASYRFLQDHFKIHKDKICRRFTGRRQSRSAREPAGTRLNQEQDKALCWFLD